MRMNRVLEVDYANQIAVVEPGLVNLHLSWAVGPQGFYYAPDPSSQQACTIGGNIANNSGGPHTLKYGVTTNHVLGLEVVLPDGELIWIGGKTRDPQGYDLTGLFVGSEGTFGIATKIVVRLMKKPQAVKTVLAVFDEVDQASEAVSAIIGRGLVPAAMEMIDQLTIQAVEDAFGCGYPRDAAAALLIEVDGLAAGMDEQAERISQACREAGARDVRVARDTAERELLWKGRKSAFGAYGRISPAYMVMDGVIPRTKLPYVLRRVNEIVAAHGLRVGNVFHAGDGNLHPNLLYDPREPGAEARVVAAGGEILKVCAEVGGSISGEHGIGLEKADYMPLIFSEADLDCMYRLRRAFNPTGLCNPGKIFPSARPAARPASRIVRTPSKRKASPSASSAGVAPPLVDSHLARRLAAIVGERHVLTGIECSPYVLEGRTPEAVVFPGARKEVAALLVLAGEDGCPSHPGAAARGCRWACRPRARAWCCRSGASTADRARAGRPHRHRRGRLTLGASRRRWAVAASGSRWIPPIRARAPWAASSPAMRPGPAGISTAPCGTCSSGSP
jgi:glycolate oxidase